MSSGMYPCSDLSANRQAQLDERLAEVGLEQEMVKGDGNCFFHALVVQLRRAQVPVVLQDMGPDEEDGDRAQERIDASDTQHSGDDEAATARATVVKYMREHPQLFEAYVSAVDEKPSALVCLGIGIGTREAEGGSRFERYLDRMEQDGEWAGELEMMAAAHCYKVHLICYAVTAGGLCEYCYSPDQDDCSGAGQGTDTTKLRMCLWKSHYWSTRPLGSCDSSLHDCQPSVPSRLDDPPDFPLSVSSGQEDLVDSNGGRVQEGEEEEEGAQGVDADEEEQGAMDGGWDGDQDEEISRSEAEQVRSESDLLDACEDDVAEGVSETSSSQ